MTVSLCNMETVMLHGNMKVVMLYDIQQTCLNIEWFYKFPFWNCIICIKQNNEMDKFQLSRDLFKTNFYKIVSPLTAPFNIQQYSTKHTDNTEF